MCNTRRSCRHWHIPAVVVFALLFQATGCSNSSVSEDDDATPASFAAQNVEANESSAQRGNKKNGASTATASTVPAQEMRPAAVLPEGELDEQAQTLLIEQLLLQLDAQSESDAGKRSEIEQLKTRTSQLRWSLYEEDQS